MDREPLPRRVHGASDAERDANARAAARFFSAPRDALWQAKYLVKDKQLLPRRLSQQKAAKRKLAVERARAWNEAHPEQRRASLARWREENRDRVRAYSRASYARRREEIAERAKRDRDRDPEKYRQRQKEWRARNPGYQTEYARKRRQNPELYARQLEQNRAAKRLARKLSESGLPPRRITRTTAAERRANEQAAGEFFSSDASRVWHGEYLLFQKGLAAEVDIEGAALRQRVEEQARRRELQGLPRVDPEQQFYARAVEAVIDRYGEFASLSGSDVRRAVAAVRQDQLRRVQREQRSSLGDELARYVRRNVTRLRRDAQIEHRARSIAGKVEQPLGLLAHRIALGEIRDRLAIDRLSPREVEMTILATHERHPALFDPRTQPAPNEGLSPAVRASFPTSATPYRDEEQPPASRSARQPARHEEVGR